MTTYKGLPGPHICDFWTREQSAANLRRRLDLPDRPDRHGRQYRHLSRRARSTASPTAPTCRRSRSSSSPPCPASSSAPPSGLAVDADAFDGLDVAGKAVLVHTGWDRHWRTDAYFEDHPFLTEAAARLLAERGAAWSASTATISTTRAPASRPVHTILLGAGILICEHMTNLGALPDSGFAFTAVPPKIAGMGTFPVRAFARIDS